MITSTGSSNLNLLKTLLALFARVSITFKLVIFVFFLDKEIAFLSISAPYVFW